MSNRPNILFIICHDLGRELGCYGAPVETPNLDRLAGEGVCFTQAFTNSPCCSPSRGCVMTGKYAHNNGLMGLVNEGWSLPVRERTVVDLFNDAGYETVHVGHQHERLNPGDNRYQLEWLDRGQYAENAVDAAEEYFQQRTDDSPPFFMNLGTVEVHESRWNRLDRFGRRAVYGVDETPPTDVPGFLPNVEPLRRELAGLRAATVFLDAQVGRLLAALDQANLRENTWVVFTTDHGISGIRSKSTLYDAGVETTLLVQGPDVANPGRQESCLMQHIDLLPTLADLAGIDIPDDVQGRSAAPLLRGESYQPHDAIFIERNSHSAENDQMRAIRTPEYHLIYNAHAGKAEQPRPDGLTDSDFKSSYEMWYNELWPEPRHTRPQWELYHVADDPFEKHNLADDPDRAAVREDLTARLRAWMVETTDVVTLPE